MSKISPLVQVMLTVIAILFVTHSASAESFTTDDGRETLTATYQAAVCHESTPKCAEPDIWQVTILWQDGVQVGVIYEKIVDNGQGSTLKEAEPTILTTTNARACMRNVRYCPQNKKP